ncbi:hypothetical protein G7046_g2330 [Stylonectria norvegica]|nr:hypothetical protein G7046_g2330 [Stylonectria norvegica]
MRSSVRHDSELPDLSPSNSAAVPTLTVHRRTERSLLTQLIQTILRPWKPLIAKAGKIHPAGSPRLTTPSKVSKRCDVREREMNGIWIYEVKAKSKVIQVSESTSRDRPKTILYFAGGGWQMPPSRGHWALVAEMACRLPNTKVTLVSYPLAPKNPASVTFPQLEKLYDTLSTEASTANENVIIAGDSSGGNIALCLVTWVLAKRELNDGIKPPVAIFAICPTTDLGHGTPGIKDVERFDPLLTLDFINSTARAWSRPPGTKFDANAAELSPAPTSSESVAGKIVPENNYQLDWTFNDPRVSPIRADLSPLVNHGIKVHGITASYDCLGPDAIVFREQCRRKGVQGEWLAWDKQMHCFPLAFNYGVKESKEAVDWMIEILAGS